MNWIDTHCHIDVPEFDADRADVLARCRDLGIAGLVVPGIHAAGWGNLLKLCCDTAGLYPALGMHPVYLSDHRSEHLEQLDGLLVTDRPVAVGEIGLDFFVTELDPQAQQALFEAQVKLARKHDLPVILHARKCHDQLLATFRRLPVRGGIVHAFNGSVQQAEQFIAMGFKLGFGGTLTYERSRRIRELAQRLPLTAIVLETDAPDIPVAAHRGERNSPEYIVDCARALAELRGMTLEAVAQATTENASAVLGFRV